MSSTSFLGVIPARGGSKGIEKKNIREVAGRPLIAWTADQVEDAARLDKTIVSTDDPEIAAVAEDSGLEVPFMRPDELAQDTTAMEPTIAHAGQTMAERGFEADYVVCLQPTSPLRAGKDIDAAIELALDEDADAVVSLVETKHHPYWAMQMGDDGQVHPFMDLDETYTRRQDLPPVYARNGAVFLSRPGLLAETHSWYAGETYGYTMPEERSLDLDTPWDLRVADLALREEHGDP